MTPTLRRFPDARTLADELARATVAFIAARQAEDPDCTVHWCLTGGSVATRALKRLGELIDDGEADAVDPTRLELWWGDERWVSATSEDRNDRPALQALAGWGLRADAVHRMPAADQGLDLPAAAAAYAEALAGRTLDLTWLGMGPDGHVASLFPGHPQEHAEGTVVAVTGSPKPPPKRLSLTMDVLRGSTAVWFCVAGSDKAAALASAMTSTDLPAGRARGTAETVVWADDAACRDL